MPADLLKCLAAAFIVAACLFLGGSGPAFAHAQLITSDPPDGAVLPQPPAVLTLKFSEPVRPLIARLSDDKGHTSVLADVGEKGQNVTFTLPGVLTRGTHILSWRVVSSDGHPIGGGLVFSVGAPSATAPGSIVQSDPVVRIGLWGARLLVICGLVFGVGGAAYRAWSLGRAGAAHFINAAIGAGLLGTIAVLPLQGLDALGAPLPSIIGRETWSAGLWSTSYGLATLLAATALLLAFASMPSRGRRILAALALLVACLAFASAGHAASAPPRWLLASAVFVHALAVLLWLGALAPLGAVLVRGGPDAIRSLGRFSTVIPAVIAALLASGTVIAVAQVQTPVALFASAYGRVLIAKLGLVAAMLTLAAVNRYAWTRRALAGDMTAAQRLSRSIGAEIALSLAVIGVLGLWRFTPPPRAMAADPARFEAQQVRASSEDVSAVLSIHPPIAGPVRVEVNEITVGGKPLKPLGVSVELSKPSYGVGPFTKEAKADDTGFYRADGYMLPLDGFWVVRATILVSDFRSATLTEVFDVRKATN